MPALTEDIDYKPGKLTMNMHNECFPRRTYAVFSCAVLCFLGVDLLLIRCGSTSSAERSEGRRLGQSLLSRMLGPLTRNETNQNLFDRHFEDFPDMEYNGTFAPSTSPAPTTSAPVTQSPTPPEGTPTAVPSAVPTTAPTTAGTDGTNQPSISPGPTLPDNLTLDQLIEATLTPDRSFDTTGTPQNSAFTTVEAFFSDLDPNNAEDQIQLLQVYGLFTLFYSTDGTNWDENNGWEDGQLPCDGDWFGLTCNGNDQVVDLLLSDNDLVGSLPSEIAGLQALGEPCHAEYPFSKFHFPTHISHPLQLHCLFH